MEQENQQKQYSKVVSVGKFIFLSTITFGLYQLVWFYRNWSLLNEKKGLNISPFWRTLFSPLFAGSIARHLKKLLKENEISCKYSSILIGISYFFISVLWKLPDPYWLVCYFNFIPMLPMVIMMNKYWRKEENNLPVKRFTWWQIILIVFLIIWLIMGIIGTFLPE